MFQKGKKDFKKLEEKISRIRDQKEKVEKLIELGKFYFLNEKYDEAISKFKEAVKIDENNAEIYYNLGIVYESKNLPEEASQMYTKALDLNPGHKLASKHLEKIVGK
jgi:tetratricopeptide (TPR) repeat protein